MDIEIIQTVTNSYRLFDGDRFLADCGKGLEGEERAKAVWDEVMNLQTACGELRGEVERLKQIYDELLTQSHQTMLAYLAADKERTDLLEACEALIDNATDSYCEWCQRHAPKNDAGYIEGAIPHRDGCAYVQALTAIKRIREE